MKKILLILFCMILLVGTISALEFDNIKELPDNFNYKENVVTIRNSFLWIFPLGKVADIQLIENTDQCLINCKTRFKVNLYADYNNPLTREYFRDRKNKNVDVNGEWYYYDNFSYEVEVPKYKEVCKLDLDSTNNSEICFKEKIGSYKETKYNSQWLKYEGGTFKKGEYEFEYRGQKPIDMDIDFKMILFGVDLGKEYIWWNSSWDRKRELSNLTGEGTAEVVYLNISYDPDMQTDFDDIRFLNSTEDGELNYYLEQKLDGEWSIFRVLSNNESSIYMYYGNLEATSNSDIRSVYGSLTNHYRLDDDDLTDSFFLHNGTNSGTTNIPGKINSARYFDGTDTISFTNGDFTSDVAYSIWATTNTTGCTGDGCPIFASTSPTDLSIAEYLTFVGTEIYYVFAAEAGSNNKYLTSGAGIQTDTFYNIVVNGTGNGAAGAYQIWINGVNQSTGFSTAGTNRSRPSGVSEITMGDRRDGGFTNLQGIVDEFSRLNETITTDELNKFYYTKIPFYVSGSEESFGPTIILNLPVDTYNSTTIIITFNGTVYADNEIINVTLILDGVYNETNSSGINNSDYIFTKTMADGNHNWTYESCDNNSRCTTPAIRTFNINTTPHIQFENPTPVNKYNSTVNYFIANVSLTETYFQNLTFYLYNQTAMVDATTYTDSTRHINWTDLADGDYSYNATVWTTTGQTNLTETRNITIEATIPEINITSPPTIIGYHIINTNLSLNWTVSDVHLDSCWYDYNETNISVTCLDNTTNLNITGNSNRNVTFYANDTYGNLNSDYREWYYKIFEVQQTFSPTTIEGSTETFVNNIFLGSEETITEINFNYNETDKSSSHVNLGENEYNFSSTFIIPAVASDTNITFFWKITLISDQINTSLENQTIKNIDVDDCSVFTNLIFNYTIVDEEQQTNITNIPVLELDMEMFDETKTISVLNFSKKYNNTNPALVCLSIDLTNEAAYALDSTVKYKAVNYSTEYYNIQNFLMQNSTIPQNIYLFDLLLTDSTEFQITFKDSNFVPVENALIQINRQYLSEGLFKTVEIPKTDSNGQTVAHLVEKDAVYNIVVLKEGETLGEFYNIIAFCEDILIGSCFITLNSLIVGEISFDYDEEIGLFYDFDYNESSRDLQFDFSTTDGSVKNVTMSAIKIDQLGNTTVCDGFLISSGGSIFCPVPVSVGNETIIVSVFIDGDLKITNYVQAGKEFDIGDAGYFLMFFLVLSLALMMTQSKTGVIIGVILGFISGVLLSFVQGGVIGIGSSVIWLIIMGVILIYKLNSSGQT